MARTIIHDDCSADVIEKAGVIYIRFHDMDNQGEILETHAFPYAKEQAVQVADRIKQKAIGLKIADASDMPQPPEGA